MHRAQHAEQAALQVKVIAPVDVLPDIMGLGHALEGALLALGLSLDSYTAMARQQSDPENLQDEDEAGDAEEGEQVEDEGALRVSDRLLDRIA